MTPQLRFGKVFTVTCADVLPEEMGPLQRRLPSWIENWLDFYLPTAGIHNPFFLTGFYIPQNDPSRCKFLFTLGGLDFDGHDKDFVKRAFTLSNRLDEDLKRFVRQNFDHRLYAWCLPQFNQFEFN